eukprot:6209086-Pleurochrysis_carterae.AAC.1
MFEETCQISVECGFRKMSYANLCSGCQNNAVMPKFRLVLLGSTTGAFLWFMLRDKTIFTKQPRSVLQRDAVAKDGSAAVKRADA